jgi:hypothetical protein
LDVIEVGFVRRDVEAAARGDPGIAASAWASNARIAEKLEGGLAGRLAGLRPQDCEVWVLVFGFLGYFLWQWTQNVVAGGLVGDLGGADVVAIYAEA